MSAPLIVAALGNGNATVAVIDTSVNALNLSRAMPTKLLEP